VLDGGAMPAAMTMGHAMRQVVTALALATLLALPARAQDASTVRGSVQSLDSSRITVDGTAYPLESETRFERYASAMPIDPARIKPGMTVVLELDPRGHVAAVRVLQPG
jgi:hypothetical protein